MSATLTADGTRPRGPEPRPSAERWRVRGSNLAGRLDSWSKTLATTHLTFGVSVTERTPAGFEGVVTRRTIGYLDLVIAPRRNCAAIAAPLRSSNVGRGER